MNLSRRSAHPQKTIAAINWPTLGWLERHSSFYPTQRTANRYLDSLAREGLTERVHIGGDAVVLSAFARLATFRLVFETLVGKKELLPCGEDKLLLAVYASQHLVVVLVHLSASYAWLGAAVRVTTRADRRVRILYEALSVNSRQTRY